MAEIGCRNTHSGAAVTKVSPAPPLTMILIPESDLEVSRLQRRYGGITRLLGTNIRVCDTAMQELSGFGDQTPQVSATEVLALLRERASSYRS